MEGLNLKDFTKVTSVTTEFVILTDSTGAAKQVSFANLKASLIPGGDLAAAYDNISIMYWGNSDNVLRQAKLDAWPALQAGGEIALGVVLYTGTKQLVIAPTQAPAILNWSSSNKTVAGATLTSNRRTALNAWAGEADTAAIIGASATDFVTDTAEYAAGFCNLYSRANTAGSGLTAGKWWLPSLAELILIRANMGKINYALSLIIGADLLSTSYHWSSTQNSAYGAWRLYFSTGYVYSHFKSTNKNYVRPVSALQ